MAWPGTCSYNAGRGMLWLHLGLLLASITVLIKAADWLVHGSAALARAWGVSEVVIGITLVGFGTSAPEFAASAAAAMRGLNQMAVANVAGSNVFNLCLILGVCSVVIPLTVERSVLRKDLPVLVPATALATFFLLDLVLLPWEAAILFGIVLLYTLLRVYTDRRSREDRAREKFRWWDLFKTMAGLGLVIASGDVLVDSAGNVARMFGVSEWVIGVTIVAGGTSLPELVASLVAAIRKAHGISVGNLVGSSIFNVCGVLGLAGLLHPLELLPGNKAAVLALLPATMIASLAMMTGRGISRMEGVILILVNAAFLFVGFM